MLYAIIALVALVILCAWLVWRCVAMRESLGKAQARIQSMQRDRAIRQNLQHLLERREAEIHRLRDQIADYESDFQEMENHANDLNMSLFRESGLRILAEKEDGAKRLKMEQLERELEDAGRKLREQQEEADENERRLMTLITDQEKEIARLRQANARRMKRPPADPALINQVTLDEVMGGLGNRDGEY